MIVPVIVLKVIFAIYVTGQYTRNVLDLVTDKQVPFGQWPNTVAIAGNVVVASLLLYVIYHMRLF